MNRKSPQNPPPQELIVSKQEEEKVAKLLDSTNKEAPHFWELDNTEEFYVPVDDGELKIIHVKPKDPTAKRPLVFLSGWGGINEVYDDYYSVFHQQVEFYYIQTREKNSSKLDRKKAKMGMDQKAKDVQDVINYLGLNKQDFVLFGTCWGGAIILHGLIQDILEAPTLVAHDPMHELWFPKWFLRYISPLLPIFFVKALKPIFKWLALFGMKEKTQKKRSEIFIDNADVWKWKKAAEAVKDFRLYGSLSKIKREVYITNGSKDKIHDQSNFPKIAKEIPNGRFIYMKTDESRRERLMGLISLEFAKVRKEDGIPPTLAQFEKNLLKLD